jgi:diguanylate cyclase (GGDEF)-like protein
MRFELDDVWLDELGVNDADRLIKRRNYRIMMVGVVGVSYLVDTFILFGFAMLGTIDMQVPFVYGGLGTGHVVLFTALHYSGFSERFGNPHLTKWQMYYAVMVQLVGMTLAPQILTFFLAIIFIIFAFGVMRISLKQALTVWLITCLAIMALFIVLPPESEGISEPSFSELVLVMASFGMILLRTVALGYYGFKLRLKMLRYAQKFENEAHSDALTGAMNRRAILHAFEESATLCQRKAIPFCVAILDVDHFKGINDTFGHLVGDRVLKQIVKSVEETIRVSDKVGRYGGEEFLLVFPATTEDEGFVLMERIRLNIRENAWERIAGTLSVTVSCGISEITPFTVDHEPISRADAALYAAKENGRDQTRTFSGSTYPDTERTSGA